jgi:hypothetical protein
MPGKETPKSEAPASPAQASPVQTSPVQASQSLPPCQPLPGTGSADLRAVLATLDQVFSRFRDQLDVAAPPPFDRAAKNAVDVFNDVVAGLQLTSRPRALKLGGRTISATEIELAWADASTNADGYRVYRSHGHHYEELVEVTREPLSRDRRSFRDCGLFGNTTYRYQVVAFNVRGETPSNVLTITTTSNPT